MHKNLDLITSYQILDNEQMIIYVENQKEQNVNRVVEQVWI